MLMSRHTRRAFLSLLVAMGGAGVLLRKQILRPEGLRRFPAWNIPRPTEQQLAWQDMELGLFIHLGMPTYTGKVGVPGDPGLFNPVGLDTDQWVAAAKAMGARYAVLVAVHADGFLAWQSEVYDYGLRQSPWRGGKGDLVGEFVQSCAKHGVKPGFYVSVADNRFCSVSYPGVVDGHRPGASAKQRAYNQLVMRMLRELLSRYGEIGEIWFDGGVLPPGEGGPDIAPLIAELQPRAMVLGGPAATIRLSGGETGTVGYPCWSTARRTTSMGQGHPEGALWLPVECDAPIRKKQWFWRPGGESQLCTTAELVQMYMRSVGRNGNFLLNANPNREGRIPEADMQRYRGLGGEIGRRFKRSEGRTSGCGDITELALSGPTWLDHVVLMEDTRHGDRVRRYRVESRVGVGRWDGLCEGRSIGHKRIHAVAGRQVSGLRLVCSESHGMPRIRSLAAYATMDT